MEHVAWLARPQLRTPTLIAAFTGWNDAGDAASLAVQQMITTWKATKVAEIDPEEFFEFQATRPHVRLVDGGAREIVWPPNEFYAASTPGGDVLLLAGTEPQLRWKSFTRQIVEVAATSMICRQNVRHLSWGSVPVSRSTSPPGVEAA